MKTDVAVGVSRQEKVRHESRMFDFNNPVFGQIKQTKWNV